MIFEDCRVPVANRVGGEGEGFRFAMAGLDGGRLNIGACSLGGAQRCLDEAVNYTKERQQFGQPIADFQNTQFMLADMATDLEAARALLYLAAAKVTDGAPDKTRFSAMAKRLATDSGSKIVNDALQLFGGYGYLEGLSDRALLARPAGALDPRRHQPGHADDRRPGHAAASDRRSLSSSATARGAYLAQPAQGAARADARHVPRDERGAAANGPATTRSRRSSSTTPKGAASARAATSTCCASRR